MQRDYIWTLPPTRFLAALFLVIFHLYFYGFLQLRQEWLVNFFAKGYIGTNLFFVVSGFILTHIYAQHQHFSPGTFYWTRAARLLPPYYLGFLLGLPIALAEVPLNAQSWSKLAGQAALYLCGLQAWVYGAPFVFDGPAWSVSVLALFYALFPGVRRTFMRASTPRIYSAIAALWLLSLLAPSVFMRTLPGAVPDTVLGADSVALNFLKTFPLFRVPELLLGMLAAVLYRRRIGQPWLSNRALPLLSFGLLALCMALIPQPSRLYPLLHNGLFTPWLMVCVLSLAYHQGLLADLGRRAWVQRLGDVSLNIFLIHIPLLAYYKHFLPGKPAVWTPVEIAGYLALVFTGGVLTERYLTKPLTVFLRGLTPAAVFRRGQVVKQPKEVALTAD